MIAWTLAHWGLLLTLWAVTHAIAQTLTVKAPPTSWYGKAAHAWSAVNPADVVKFLAQFKSSMPPSAANAVEQAATQLGAGK